MLGEPLLRLDECDSTNRIALEWEDAPHGAAVVARVQSGGRGRLGRSWESAQDKGLYLSLVLRREQSAAYSLLSALGAARAIQKLTKIPCRVKWPNDVVAISPSGEVRKIGGILGESKGAKLVVGIGINVNQNLGELPVRPLFPASSLAIEIRSEWEIDAVLTGILAELDALFVRLESGDWNELRADFERVCLGHREVVQIKTGETTWVGVFDSVGEDGALLLRTPDGVKRFLAGDVSYF